MKQSGLLITLEGIDGSGKSTLAKHLYDALSEKYQVVLTREPGGSQLGKSIRPLTQKQTIPLTPKAEYLLFAADRAQHFDEIVIPALQQNKIVISDRMGDSSVVYQGYARGLDIAMIQKINNWATSRYKPDVTIFVKIDPKTARERLCSRKDLTSFEKEKEEFMHKVARGFCELFSKRDNIIIVDGSLNEQAVFNQTMNALQPWILRYET